MWKDFGFRKNPYDTHPIGADDEGVRLLVGREQELRKLKNRIANVENTVCVEGPNGVGKTSLVLVAGRTLQNETSQKGKNSLLLLPEPFQLLSTETSTDFKRKVYGKIASYFIENEAELVKRLDLQFNLKPLTAWLENPIFHSGNISIAGFGGGGSRDANQSSGFDNHGFFTIVERLLNRAFLQDGGVVCVLDNLEILNTSQNARSALEEMRDDILSRHGIKWVVCGARGIVKAVATSARLQGRLQEPMEILPLSEDVIPDLIASRTEIFADNPAPSLPVSIASFTRLYEVLNKNLRDALKFSADFALWLFEEGHCESTDEFEQLFDIWLAEQSESYFSSAHVPPRAWRLFDDICTMGGVISPSDYQLFVFNSPQSMRGQITPLENHDLIYSEVDESDNRRRTISITAKGWMVTYHRQGYRLLSPDKPGH